LEKRKVFFKIYLDSVEKEWETINYVPGPREEAVAIIQERGESEV
jgi:hypothetical protein